jgi:hypothetical protein
MMRWRVHRQLAAKALLIVSQGPTITTFGPFAPSAQRCKPLLPTASYAPRSSRGRHSRKKTPD